MLAAPPSRGWPPHIAVELEFAPWTRDRADVSGADAPGVSVNCHSRVGAPRGPRRIRSVSWFCFSTAVPWSAAWRSRRNRFATHAVSPLLHRNRATPVDAMALREASIPRRSRPSVHRQSRAVGDTVGRGPARGTASRAASAPPGQSPEQRGPPGAPLRGTVRTPRRQALHPASGVLQLAIVRTPTCPADRSRGIDRPS
jgi:hypothetical protein